MIFILLLFNMGSMNKVENEHLMGEYFISWWHRCSGSVLCEGQGIEAPSQEPVGQVWGGVGWDGDGDGADTVQQRCPVAKTLEQVTSRS